jgi:hypothetical protein
MVDSVAAHAETVSDRHWADAWLYAVLADRSLSAGTKTIATLLRLHLNAGSWISSPSVEGLAQKSSQTTRAVEKQRDALRDAGLIDWRASGGRVRNKYFLIITPNVRRELARIYPEHSAAVENDNSEPLTPVAGANHELLGGVKKDQPRTLVPATPNRRPSNPERTAGQTIKPVKTLSGSAPRAPDGAAVAAQLGEPGKALLAKIGPGKMVCWFGGAGRVDGEPATITVPKQFQVNWITSHFQLELEQAFQQPVAVRVAA